MTRSLKLFYWDTIRTPQPVPSIVPEIEADSSVIRRLSFRLRGFSATNWGKPDHVRAIEFAWSIREGRSAIISELPHLETATANHIIINFEEEECGSHVFFSARWLSNTAQPGSWSDIESAIIP
jgi:hypothetical protein